MFVDRQQELRFLNQTITRDHPGPAQLLMVYGRRRVGKSALLRHWAIQSGFAYTYWVAEKEPAALQRRKLYAKVLNLSLRNAPTFDSWSEVWAALIEVIGNQRYILILDEFTYTSEADPAVFSSLQHAWDQSFQGSNAVIVLCGSHVRAMEMLLTRQSPLFGRMTGQWYLQPLPFAALREFFPHLSVEERVALYAITGGVPAYLEWLNPNVPLVENIRDVILTPGSMFVAEPTFLLYDEVREPQIYLAILKAIGAGNHTLNDISNASLVNKSHLPPYLARLQELKLVERRLPATLTLADRRQSRKGRYHLSDAYFRFYFRFLAPYQDVLNFDNEPVLRQVQQELRAFVGQTAWEELARMWVTHQGRKGELPLNPDHVGSHWNRYVQADVVAIQRQTKQILIGECKWGLDAVERQVVRDLIEVKTPKVLRDLPNEGEGWRVTYAIFARTQLTASAQQELERHHGIAVTAEQLSADLADQ